MCDGQRGSDDKMQYTVIALKGNVRRVDMECLALKEGLESSLAKFLLSAQWSAAWEQSYRRHQNGASRFLSNAWTTLEGDFFDTRFCACEETVCGWNQYTTNTK